MTPDEVTVVRDTSHERPGDPALDVTRLTPSAPVTVPEAAEAVQACFGLSGQLARLPGEADDNFLLRANGEKRYVVKVAHERADPRVVGVQVRVLRHIESVAAALPVPRVVPAADGRPWAVVADGPLRGRVVHVVSYLDGQLLKSVPTDQTLRRTLGATLARLGRALREFDDPLVRRPLLWDIAQLPQLSPLLAGLADHEGTSVLGEQHSRLAASLPPRLTTQRTQLVHNNFSPDNVLVSADASHVCGIIDFGDVTVTALVNDVAIAATYQLSDEADLLPARAGPDIRLPRHHPADRRRTRPAAGPDPGPHRGPDRHQRMASRTVPRQPRLHPAQHPEGVGAPEPVAEHPG